MDGAPHIDDLGLQPQGFEGDDYLVLLPLEPRHMNIRGIVHGGVICSLLDTAMARAFFMGPEGKKLSASTLEMKVNFLAPVSEGTISARGRVVKTTRRTAYVEGEVLDVEGRLAARGSATIIRLVGE